MSVNAGHIIEASGLHYSYGDLVAVHSLDLKIREGEFFGLLGPNGAGKTTTISILSTLLVPQRGNVRIKGLDLCGDRMAARRIIGIVPQEIALYNELTATENLIFWGRLYGIERSVCRARANELLDLAGLADRKNEAVSHYSGGMKRRVNLAVALMHSPSLLLMDEPTVGIDPQSRNHIFDMLEALHAQGMTIIYTTHYMEEVERLCTRAAIIDHGRIIADGTLDELKAISAAQADSENHAPTLETVFLDLTGRTLRDV